MSRLGRKLLRGLKEAADMYGLKREKLPWYKAAIETLYLSDLADYIFEPYYYIRHKISKCIKVIQFIPYVWRHEDWDWAYTVEFMQYLFKRLYDGVYTNGHHVERPKDRRRLKTVVELLKRMSDSHTAYQEKHYAYLEAKFGPIDYGFEKVSDGPNGRTYTTLVDKRAKALNPSDRALYEKMKSNVYKLEDQLFKQDMELFCKIMKKDIRKWWD